MNTRDLDDQARRGYRLLATAGVDAWACDAAAGRDVDAEVAQLASPWLLREYLTAAIHRIAETLALLDEIQAELDLYESGQQTAVDALEFVEAHTAERVGQITVPLHERETIETVEFNGGLQ